MEDGTQKEPVGSVLDAFRGHFYKKVKAHNANHPLLKWLMMDGGIAPKAQPLDALINKVFKGFLRDLFEDWFLNAPTNPKTGHPVAPYRKFLHSGLSRRGPRFQKNLFGNRGKSVDTSKQRI